ncbi:hypothetical protein WJX74_007996 [Apatococcus lobatus]|uniref:Actin-related protein 8 n=1 Tax=Apatococcus lobatus TaxID=904363 RepID=A0AAW1QDH0_9CHLO
MQAAESLIARPQRARAADTSLADAILASASCLGDTGLRKACLETLLVCGGGSSIPGIIRRLVSELHQLCPPSITPQPVTCPEYMPEQSVRYSSWMGGAILSKIAFQQNQHASKYDYNESGPSIIHRKCG